MWHREKYCELCQNHLANLACEMNPTNFSIELLFIEQKRNIYKIVCVAQMSAR